MNHLDAMIRKLQKERDRLDRIIASLERLRQTANAAAETKPAPIPKRRGRKFMNEEDRLEVSVRMKKYWAARRNRDGTA